MKTIAKPTTNKDPKSEKRTKQIIIKKKNDAKKERIKGNIEEGKYEGKEETKGRTNRKKTKAAAG
jgi:hypothetical protein